MALASVVAAAGLSAVAAAAVALAEFCECSPFATQAIKAPIAEGEDPFPQLTEQSPQVRTFRKGRHEQVLRISLYKDVLLLGSDVGPAAEVILLSGAQVDLHNANAMVILTPKLSPAITFWLRSPEEAVSLAESLQEASEYAARVKTLADESAQNEQRAQSAKIAALEARVSATLQAAYDRAQRVRELEAEVAEGKKKDQRIEELEDMVKNTLAEAEARSSRIRELEWDLMGKPALTRDYAAEAVLDDAMRFAEQMLENREEHVLDTGGVSRLQEALAAVQEAKPQVDEKVADLVSKLVSALRWPLVLRQRLADAEQDVKETKEEQGKTLLELRNLQARRRFDEEDKAQKAAQIESLRKQLVLAEESAKQIQDEAEALRQESLASGPELERLKEAHAIERQTREQAEAEARQLRREIMEIEQAAQEGLAKQLEIAEASHEEELFQLTNRKDEIEAKMQEAEERAEELKKLLSFAEKVTEERVARNREELRSLHDQELMTAKRVAEAAEVNLTQAKEQAEKLRQQLQDAEASKDAAVAMHRTEKEQLDAELGEALAAAKRERAAAEEKAREVERRLQVVTEAANADKEKQKAERERVQLEAEQEAQALRQRLQAAEVERDAAVSRGTQLEAAHSQEARKMATRAELAEQNREQAELERAEKEREVRALREQLDRLEAQHAMLQQAQDRSERITAMAKERELQALEDEKHSAEREAEASVAREQELSSRLAEAEPAAQSDEEVPRAPSEKASPEKVREEYRLADAAREQAELLAKQAASTIQVIAEDADKQRRIFDDTAAAVTNPAEAEAQEAHAAQETSPVWVETRARELLSNMHLAAGGVGLELDTAMEKYTIGASRMEMKQEMKQQLENRVATAEQALSQIRKKDKEGRSFRGQGQRSWNAVGANPESSTGGQSNSYEGQDHWGRDGAGPAWPKYSGKTMPSSGGSSDKWHWQAQETSDTRSEGGSSMSYSGNRRNRRRSGAHEGSQGH